MFENSLESIKKAQTGDKVELGKLIKDNNRTYMEHSKRFNGRGYELEDLYQIGCIGFIKSIQRFDTNFEVKLSTYSVPYMIRRDKKIYKR